MAGGYAWSRRVGARVRTLRGLVADTQRALHDVVDILSIDAEVSSFVQEIGNQSLRTSALVVLGNSSRARARLLHCLLGRQLLPEDMPRGCRWIRIQYGSSTQVHLSLGNSEFELVEELESTKRAWDVLPVEDLIRQDATDLTTILEVELNNQFLRDGLRIIIPPDIATDPGTYNHIQLKNIHSELYTKRACILKNFNCVYLYAVDKMGKNIFSDNICGNTSQYIISRRSEEDFWNTFSLYTGSARTSTSSAGNDGADDKIRDGDKATWSFIEGGEPAVFSSENCLDLRQIKDMNRNAQLLFFLFNDSVEMGISPSVHVNNEATESTGDAVICSGELPESDKDIITARELRQTSESPEPKQACDTDKPTLLQEQIAFMNELIEQWELMSNPPQKHYIKSQWAILDDTELLSTVDLKHTPAYTAPAHSAGGTCSKARRDEKIIKNRSLLLSVVVKYAMDALQSYLLDYCTRLSEVHIKLLQQFILASFDMARELQVVPKKIQYVAIHEQHLFETINEKFSEGDKKQELLQMMQEVLQELKTDINTMDWSVDDLPCHQDLRFAISNSTFYYSIQNSAYLSFPLSSLPPSGCDQTPSDGEEATSYDSYNLEEYEIIGRHDESCSECFNNTSKPDEERSPSPPTAGIRVENETEMLSLSSATQSAWTLRSDVTCCSRTGVSVQHATTDVQQTVLTRLSRKISLKLVKFFDCLKESYFGTLQRCLESLESSCRQELGGKPASEAMRQLLSVGRQVELQPGTAFSLLRTLLDSFRRLFQKLIIVGGEDEEACCVLSPVWRRRVALQTAHSLSPHRLARIISTQIIERLSVAHERYQAALASLESALASRLHHTEDTKLAIRKKYAPLFARLCLESTSMCDLLMYGTPELGREIGRGQYGVVYSVRGGWAGHSPVAVKSVLPADERHYHELAMEFFYTRSIPSHPRIVRLFGSVVQRTGGNGRCVLLVSARKVRDLHAAVRAGLPDQTRMRIAQDIVEGIRYLHSLGLVHRDIKLKNVLLDGQNRAALSDLGFCTTGALMSGSIVGTPVHMAPELLGGDYCSTVDVYAFGILFWYLCAGDVRLPAAFELFHNKEQLWSKVKKGLRPERLPQFSDECWSVMESCWHAEPEQRALLGDVQQQLHRILEHAVANENVSYVKYDTDEDSLDMTGIHGYDKYL